MADVDAAHERALTAVAIEADIRHATATRMLDAHGLALVLADAGWRRTGPIDTSDTDRPIERSTT